MRCTVPGLMPNCRAITRTPGLPGNGRQLRRSTEGFRLGTHEAILRLAAKEAKEKMSLPYPPPYQDLATLSQHICAAESTIENWVRIGIFPQPRKVGGKRLWQWKEVERHLAKMNDTAESLPDEEAQRIREATRAAASRSY